MSVLLVLEKDVVILKLLIAVIAEWLEHIHSLFFAAHFSYVKDFINLIL